MSTAMKIASPPMWVGGRHASAKRIVAAFPPSQMYERYVEVFEGAAHVLFEKAPGNHLEVYSDVRAVIEDPNEVNKPGELLKLVFRHGVLHLMAALSVADGLVVYGQCHPRKRFIDFRSFLETVVVAEARRRGVRTVTLILDNGPIHASKQLPGWVGELTTRSKGKLMMQLHWLPTNASWLDQIEIWFSLLQRKLMQPTQLCASRRRAG